jgi:hypothetical protein
MESSVLRSQEYITEYAGIEERSEFIGCHERRSGKGKTEKGLVTCSNSKSKKDACRSYHSYPRPFLIASAW